MASTSKDNTVCLDDCGENINRVNMEIECEYVTLSSSKLYACKVLKASITTPHEVIVSVKGNHQHGKSNDDVTWVSFFNDSKIEYFPRNLQKIFPNLNDLRIQRCGLKEISHDDLVGLGKLNWLSLSSNQIKSLPDDLFENMPNLKKVFLRNNQIEFASSKLVEPIKNDLKYFDLRHNKTIDERYIQGSNYGCQTIEKLMERIDKKCKPPGFPRTQTLEQEVFPSLSSGSDCSF